VRVADGPGNCERGFVCPFHGWCYAPDGTNTFVPRAKAFSEHNLCAGDIDLVPVRCETWGGCAWINLDAGAPPLRRCIEPAATILDAWKVESLRTEWWYAARLPVNWKLAEEAFVEQYHVVETHPQLRIPGRYAPRKDAFDARAFVAADLRYLQTMSEGMAGMVHANDVRVAEDLRDIELPDDPDLAIAEWNRALNDAVVRWHRGAGHDIPDLNDLEARGVNEPMAYGFPHYFVLPMYSSASSYRFRPIGRGRCRPSRGSATTRAGPRSPHRTSPTCLGSRRVCTRVDSSTCASPGRWRGTSRTSTARSTASSPGFPTNGCSPRCAR
jgi:hypothetical protein